MNRSIRKVAIVGSGVMGSRIACHFAGIGVQVLLLDIVPHTLTDAETAKGLTLADVGQCEPFGCLRIGKCMGYNIQQQYLHAYACKMTCYA